ncbi:hypothetical protein I6A84_23285 [Frankia sp. CNm7]|uniref:Uncharacterized protein n=1 Tax=Frankia nepalensis TaxID=1836974 RepID=A0A937RQ80_9ACTN|nr:DUF5947 family protein [Frankia nepalensis]MBL7495891.1 hypothetical protein [Frankia nepalensis]MBL7510382.1 hypothetical protein [Frankia nepalensis]MBL7520931.1 hypothetical protein [Frankia nepalensis]MBL7629981.1 hypothetical protein [Frankia nepalensis]
MIVDVGRGAFGMGAGMGMGVGAAAPAGPAGVARPGPAPGTGGGADAGFGLGAADGALRRAARRSRYADARGSSASERCHLCAVPLPEPHRHLLDEQDTRLRCVCQACALLFERDAAGRGHYVLVPRRRLALPGFSPGTLGIPVGLAFFVVQPDGRVVAHYPSPLGVTHGEVDPAVWAEARARCAEVGTLKPLVESVLVNTAKGANEHWIVPIDFCYRLVALLRAEWKGMSGGSTVWPAIDELFGTLAPGQAAARPALADRSADRGAGSAPRGAHPSWHDTSVRADVPARADT